jgi:hypothetical protein
MATERSPRQSGEEGATLHDTVPEKPSTTQNGDAGRLIRLAGPRAEHVMLEKLSLYETKTVSDDGTTRTCS